eukprot:TRINITY_DN57625_c0_g1_i1.p1 TRINITY_DN57625_c0_g1~~TRINITY_DN57625_c0_g1_i1.p1  ORF type:complete len:528 (-),score=35.24 TRINITY_DN57625_c0_g1_i1:208-1791(-)
MRHALRSLIACVHAASSAAVWSNDLQGCCKDVVVRVALPDFSSPPVWEFHGTAVNESEQKSGIRAYSGFAPRLMHELTSSMGMDLRYVTFTPYNKWEDPFQSLIDGSLDMVFSDSTIPPHAHAKDISHLGVPFITQYTRALVYKSTKGVDRWALFGPFSGDLWFAVIVFIFLFAMAIVVLQLLDVQNRGRLKDELMPRSLVKALYHSLAAALGGEDYRWTTGSGRVLRLGLLFLVLILLPTYTANLAAFYTAPAFIVHGPKDMTALSQATVCTPYDAWYTFVDPFVGKRVVPPWGDDSSRSVFERDQYCIEELRARRVDAYVDADVAVSRLALDNQCKDLEVAPAISFAPIYFHGVVANNPHGQDLGWNLTRSMMTFLGSSYYQKLVEESLGFGQSCEPSESQDVDQITLDRMSGLFTVCAGTIALALIIGVGERMGVARAHGSIDARERREYSMNDSSFVEASGNPLLQVLVSKLKALEESHRTKANTDNKMFETVLAKISSLESSSADINVLRTAMSEEAEDAHV